MLESVIPHAYWQNCQTEENISVAAKVRGIGVSSACHLAV
jgi:hypothetical protein